MATDQVGESRDVGTLLHEGRQVLDGIAIGMPVARPCSTRGAGRHDDVLRCCREPA
jgi:hypothetical protein